MKMTCLQIQKHIVALGAGLLLKNSPVSAPLMRLLWAAAAVLPTLGVKAAVVFTTLHAFQVFTNGASPEGALVLGNDGNFYGTTAVGGTNGNNGTVFRINTNGEVTSLYSFSGEVMGGHPKPGWCRAPTAISMERQSSAARLMPARCSKSALTGC